jgi:hypothetical protein
MVWYVYYALAFLPTVSKRVEKGIQHQGSIIFIWALLEVAAEVLYILNYY